MPMNKFVPNLLNSRRFCPALLASTVQPVFCSFSFYMDYDQLLARPHSVTSDPELYRCAVPFCHSLFKANDFCIVRLPPAYGKKQKSTNIKS